MNLHRPTVEPLPEINLDAFKICIYKRWRLGELVYYNMAMFFGVFSSSDFHGCYLSFDFGILIHLAFNGRLHCCIADVLAFSIIAVTARRSRMFEYPTMPSILKIILRDATHYFVLIVSAHFLSTLFLFVLPVSGQSYVQGSLFTLCSSWMCVQANIQLLPAV